MSDSRPRKRRYPCIFLVGPARPPQGSQEWNEALVDLKVSHNDEGFHSKQENQFVIKYNLLQLVNLLTVLKSNAKI